MDKRLILYAGIFIGVLLIGIGLYSVVSSNKTVQETSNVNANRVSTSFPSSMPQNISTPILQNEKTWKEIKSGRVQASQLWTDIGTFEGEIKIEVSGSATFDPRMSPISPEGISDLAPEGYLLIGARQYSCLIKYGRIEVLGSGKELSLSSKTDISLGVNEDVRGTHGNSFADNSGYWTYTVFSNQPEQSKEVTVRADEAWNDTGINVKKGQKVTISASGSVVWDARKPAVDPNGTFPATTVQQPSDFPIPEAGCGSLVMRIGGSKYAVGASKTIIATENGNIEFIVNDRYNFLFNNSGSFTVQVKVDK